MLQSFCQFRRICTKFSIRQPKLIWKTERSVHIDTFNERGFTTLINSRLLPSKIKIDYRSIRRISERFFPLFRVIVEKGRFHKILLLRITDKRVYLFTLPLTAKHTKFHSISYVAMYNVYIVCRRGRLNFLIIFVPSLT